MDLFKFVAQVLFNISRSVISNLVFRATRDDEPNGDIGLQGDLANQCEDTALRIEVFAFVEPIDDDYRRVSRGEESNWFNDESLQLDSSGHIREGKVLHHRPIDRLEHTIHVH